MRLNSALDDRKAWLNSLAQATVGNTLEKLKDEEEPALLDKLKSFILELDSLTALSKSDKLFISTVVNSAKSNLPSVHLFFIFLTSETN